MRILFLSLMGLMLAACDVVDCVRNSDCPSGYYCNEVLTCQVRPTDDAGADGGTAADAATGDLATPDLTMPDLTDVTSDLTDVTADLSPATDFTF